MTTSSTRHRSLGTCLGAGWGDNREPEGVSLVHISKSMLLDCSTEPPPHQGRKGQAGQVCPHVPYLTPAPAHRAPAAAHSSEAAWRAGYWRDPAMIVIFRFDSSLPVVVIHHMQQWGTVTYSTPLLADRRAARRLRDLHHGERSPTHHRDGCSLACSAGPWR